MKMNITKKIIVVTTAVCLFSFYSQGQSLSESIARGQEVYLNECVTCHMDNGEGISGAFPPLANSDYFKNDISKAVKVILNGLEGEVTVNGTTYYGVMDPVDLTDQEVADVLNYIQNNWGGKAKAISVKDVAQLK
ncbi:cytochrome c [Reichenbachiella carrageenanivorans]|uniref:Cytochrome c n=1 Tax=Reichenbachiella carrageenanivorans TaxID=2979869 RepID=A0ABY6CY96_9BACT|nr:cytochrome c [Reichenbachiella carrageenanivorans]UXX78345.1 cytochrome c [Reichenbachiella carrageenanivorans]